MVHVEINRPEKLNAFFEAMWQELSVIFKTLSNDPNVRCILLSGADEKAFCAGLDIQDSGVLNTLGGSGDPSRAAKLNINHIKDFQACISTISECSKPVIVLYHGFAYGLAIDIGVAADIRLCTETTRFSVKEVDIGLAADIGTLTRLPKVCGTTSWVKEICLSAREFNGAEALTNSFVSAVFKDKAEVFQAGMKMAQLIASKSPVAVQGTKRIMDFSHGRPVEEGLEYTAVWNAAMLQTSDLRRALEAGMQRKQPTFEKL